MENNNNVLEIRGLNSYFFTEKGVAPAVMAWTWIFPRARSSAWWGRAAAAKA